MKKYLFIALSIFCSFVFLIASPVSASDVTLITSSSDAPTSLTPTNYPPQPAMFVIKSKTATVYLFGSQHRLDPGTKWRTSQFDYALAAADTIWLESTSLEMANPLLQWTDYKSADNGDKMLTDLLSKDEFARLEKVARDQGLDIMDYNTLHPWVVSDILEGAQYKKEVEKDETKKVKSAPGAENIIEAMSIGKPIKALENTRKHVLLFSTLSPDDEKALLMNTVSEIEKSEHTDMDKLKTAWRTGDLDTMDRLSNLEMEKRTPGLFKAMILTRNQVMADGIIKQLQGTGTNFVAVGAGHLAGKYSVLTLLEKAGYAPERIYDTAEPITSTTNRKMRRPHYRVGHDVPPYLNVSLRKDKDADSGNILVHLSFPRAINGCAELSPIEYRTQTDEDGMSIYTFGFLVNIHPWPIRDGCGEPSKSITADIPVALDGLKKVKTKTLRFFFPGGVDTYTLDYDEGTISLNTEKDSQYYYPDEKNQTLTGF